MLLQAKTSWLSCSARDQAHRRSTLHINNWPATRRPAMWRAVPSHVRCVHELCVIYVHGLFMMRSRCVHAVFTLRVLSTCTETRKIQGFMRCSRYVVFTLCSRLFTLCSRCVRRLPHTCHGVPTRTHLQTPHAHAVLPPSGCHFIALWLCLRQLPTPPSG